MVALPGNRSRLEQTFTLGGHSALHLIFFTYLCYGRVSVLNARADEGDNSGDNFRQIEVVGQPNWYIHNFVAFQNYVKLT